MEPLFMISIQARAIIASNNFAKDDANRQFNMGITMDLMTESKELVTVLGNIVTGAIRVSGTPLGTPWSPLNMQNTSL